MIRSSDDPIDDPIIMIVSPIRNLRNENLLQGVLHDYINVCLEQRLEITRKSGHIIWSIFIIHYQSFSIFSGNS